MSASRGSEEADILEAEAAGDVYGNDSLLKGPPLHLAEKRLVRSEGARQPQEREIEALLNLRKEVEQIGLWPRERVDAPPIPEVEDGDRLPGFFNEILLRPRSRRSRTGSRPPQRELASWAMERREACYSRISSR